MKLLGKHPKDGRPVEVYAGRYGPYVKHGDTNATLPDRERVDALTLDEAVALVDDKAGRSPTKPRRTPATTRKVAREPKPAPAPAARARVARGAPPAAARKRGGKTASPAPVARVRTATKAVTKAAKTPSTTARRTASSGATKVATAKSAKPATRKRR
ncbi:MAG TPA: topoisomerase C-terminal repeat-containing protein [Casimicrobiaceae bacterium]|nr:topoisomerase C-terminal repeat-containing protein [Casimicrobiaceae bacterium]